jgi:glycosyltransferase involved in cell wall biosynthesis/ubiquinone/menaquinone biosynthesis C-methylase UbiE
VRILLTTHQFFPKHGSGTEVLARDTGLELMKRGHEVHVLTVDHSLQSKLEEITHEDYEYQGLKVRALGLPRPAKSMDYIRYEYDNEPVARHVRRYLRDVAPDAVHLFHAARLSASVIDVFKEANLPIVYTPTDFWAICVRNTMMKPSGELSEGPDDISSNCLECREVEKLLPETLLQRKTEDKQAFYREIAELALARREDEHPSMAVVRLMLARTGFLRERFNSVDAILAPTQLMREMLVSNGVDPELVTLSPYGMDVSRFRDLDHSRNGAEGLRLGYIGTIHPQKGLRVLIEAFEKLPRDADVTLRVCGDLTHFPEYARETYEMAHRDPRINFAGTFPNEKMVEELKKIDVLVVPSIWYENTPLVIYSALAARIPVVATNLGGMAEVVHHGENGLLFETGNPEDLARQLNRLLAEPDTLSSYSANAGDVRSVEDSVDEMLELYERLREKKAREREQTVSDHWARNVEARQSGEFAGNWLDHKAVLRLYINPMSTGSPDETWFDYVARTYFQEPVERALSLGCGGGGLERHALALGICQSFDAYDISEGSVEAAREEARRAGLLDRINYGVADLNRISLEENVYDAVFASMSIHHLENLEGVFSELNKALKPGGLFVFNEFVGPSQFQWTESQLALANELLASVPERYRINNRGKVLRKIKAPTIQSMNEMDPSESIRSAEIMPLTERHFDIVERRDYGGTLLHLVTAAGTIGNYSANSEEDVAVLRRMIDFEKRHIAAGDLSSDFTLVIARNPKGGVGTDRDARG